MGLKRPDVLASIAVSQNEQPNGVDDYVDDSSVESEGEARGESTFSDQETIAGNQDALPKAITSKTKTKRGRTERIITPEEVREHLRRLFRNEQTMCTMVFGRHGLSSVGSSSKATPWAEMFFVEALPVSPTRFRPPAQMGETVFEHPANELLAKVLSTTYRLRDINAQLRFPLDNKADDPADRPRLMARFLDDLIQLQIDVNSFMDSSKNPTPMRQGKLPPAGIKQGLEKKEGMFRKHMMVRLACVEI